MLFWLVCAIFGHFDRSASTRSPSSLLAKNSAPSGAHLFGTDDLGRDVLSRVIVGARDILLIAPFATLLGAVLGTVLGLVDGLLRRRG